MIENKNDLVKEWYRFAMMDLDSARHLCSLRPKPFGVICYLCQQSAEKFLKGFLISHDIEAPRTHDLLQLREMCAEVSDNFEDLLGICSFLTTYGVQPRYPNQIEVSEADVERALRNIRAMVEFFENHNLMKRLPSGNIAVGDDLRDIRMAKDKAADFDEFDWD